jgi:hypothetical protein
MWGLYQHKVSFGGKWLELAGAHEIVLRRNRYKAGRWVARVERVAARVAGPVIGRFSTRAGGRR